MFIPSSQSRNCKSGFSFFFFIPGFRIFDYDPPGINVVPIFERQDFSNVYLRSGPVRRGGRLPMSVVVYRTIRGNNGYTVVDISVCCNVRGSFVVRFSPSYVSVSDERVCRGNRTKFGPFRNGIRLDTNARNRRVCASVNRIRRPRCGILPIFQLAAPPTSEAEAAGRPRCEVRPVYFYYRFFFLSIITHPLQHVNIYFFIIFLYTYVLYRYSRVRGAHSA